MKNMSISLHRRELKIEVLSIQKKLTKTPNFLHVPNRHWMKEATPLIKRETIFFLFTIVKLEYIYIYIYIYMQISLNIIDILCLHIFFLKCCLNIHIYIYICMYCIILLFFIRSCCKHWVLDPLAIHPNYPSFLHLVSGQSWCRANSGLSMSRRPKEYVMSLFSLHQQRPSYIIYVSWIIFDMGGKWH